MHPGNGSPEHSTRRYDSERSAGAGPHSYGASTSTRNERWKRFPSRILSRPMPGRHLGMSAGLKRRSSPWPTRSRFDPGFRLRDRRYRSLLCRTGAQSHGNRLSGRADRQSETQGSRAKPAVNFLVMDALTLANLPEVFDSAVDSGLFHTFSDEDRGRYVNGLASVIKPGGRFFLLCFSDAEPGAQGPRRVSQQELEAAFADGWVIESIEPSRFEVRPESQRHDVFGGRAEGVVRRRTARGMGVHAGRSGSVSGLFSEHKPESP